MVVLLMGCCNSMLKERLAENQQMKGSGHLKVGEMKHFKNIKQSIFCKES